MNMLNNITINRVRRIANAPSYGLYVAVLLTIWAAAIAGCSGGNGQTNGETNWMQQCSDKDSCSDGLSCLCGICTVACSESEVGSCDASLDAAVCVGKSAQPGVGCFVREDAAICLPSCAEKTCDTGSSCIDGACVPATLLSDPEIDKSQVDASTDPVSVATPSSGPAIETSALQPLSANVKPVLVRQSPASILEYKKTAIAPDGTIVEVWLEQIDDRWRVVSTRYEVGRGWSEAVPIDDASAAMPADKKLPDDLGRLFSIHIDSQGRAVAMWPIVDFEPKNVTLWDRPIALWSNTYIPETGWSRNPARITQLGQELRGFSFALNDKGRGILVWNHDAGFGAVNRLWSRRFSIEHGWSPHMDDILQTPSEDYPLPKVFLNDAGDAHLIWRQDEEQQNRTFYDLKWSMLGAASGGEAQAWTRPMALETDEEALVYDYTGALSPDGTFTVSWIQDGIVQWRHYRPKTGWTAAERIVGSEGANSPGRVYAAVCGEKTHVYWLPGHGAPLQSIQYQRADNSKTPVYTHEGLSASGVLQQPVFDCTAAGKGVLLRYQYRKTGQEFDSHTALVLESFDGNNWQTPLWIETIGFKRSSVNFPNEAPQLGIGADGRLTILVDKPAGGSTATFAVYADLGYGDAVEGIPEIQPEGWSKPVDLSNEIDPRVHNDNFGGWYTFAAASRKNNITLTVWAEHPIKFTDGVEYGGKLWARWQRNGTWQDAEVIADVSGIDIYQVDVAINEKGDALVLIGEESKKHLAKRLHALNYSAGEQRWSGLTRLADLNAAETLAEDVVVGSASKPIRTTFQAAITEAEAVAVWMSFDRDGVPRSYIGFRSHDADQNDLSNGWSAPEELIADTDITHPDGGLLPVVDPRVAANDSGDIVVAWSNSALSSFFGWQASLHNDGFFAAEGDPAVTDPDSTYRDDARVNTVWVKRYKGNRELGSAENLTAGDSGVVARRPAVVIDDDGDAAVAWTSINEGEHRIVLRRYNAADANWADEHRMAHPGEVLSNQSLPDLAISPAGVILATWMRRGLHQPNPASFAVRYIPGTGWSEENHIADEHLSTISTQIAIDDRGRAVAAWYDTSSPSTLWTSYTDDDFSWHVPTAHFPGHRHPLRPIHVAIDDDGRQHVASTRAYDLWYADLQTPSRPHRVQWQTTTDDGSVLAPTDAAGDDVWLKPVGTVRKETQLPVEADTSVIYGKDIEWSGDIKVTSALTIETAHTLTIRPGTVMTFAPGASLTVRGRKGSGSYTRPGTVVFNGSEAEPIQLVSADKKQSWRGVNLIDVKSQSTMQHVVIRHVDATKAEAGEQYPLAVGSGVKLNHIAIESSSGQAAIKFEDDIAEGSGDFRIADMTGGIFEMAVYNTAGSDVGSLSLTKVSNPQIYAKKHVSSDDLKAELVRSSMRYNFPAANQNDGPMLIYAFGSSIKLGEEDTLKVAPSVTLRLSKGSSIECKGCKVDAKGIQKKPIVFESIDDDGWLGMSLKDVDKTSVIQHAIFRNATRRAALAIGDVPITLNQIRFENNKSGGLDVGARGLSPTSGGLDFSKNGAYPASLTLHLFAAESFPEDTIFVSPDQSSANVGRIALRGATGDHYKQRVVLPKRPVPYRLQSDVDLLTNFNTYDRPSPYVASLHSLVIEAGVVVEFSAATDENPPGLMARHLIRDGVHPAIVVEGIESNPVIFRYVGKNFRGDWSPLTLANTCPESRIRHLIVEAPSIATPSIAQIDGCEATIENISYKAVDPAVPLSP